MNVPRLRFNEFDQEWQVKSLGDIFNIVVGFVGTIATSYCDELIGIQFIRTLNVKNGFFSLDNIQYVTKEFHFANKKSQIFNDDILIARVGANMGMVCKVTGLNNEANSANVLIIKNDSKNNSDFYSLYLSCPKGQKQIQAKGAGGAQEVLNTSVAKTIIVPVPILPEQTKIANFLTAVDEKIAQLTQKCDLLVRYKKGVMQQIFSQQLRFKDDDGREFPDWEDKELKDIAQINPKTGSLPNEFIYIDLESVEKGILLKETTISKDEAPSRAQRLLKKEDVLFQMVRPYQMNNLFFNETGHYVASTGYAQIRVNENARYLYHFLHLNDFIAEVMNRCTGTSYPAINSSDLATMSIQIPVKEEQTKIANFLTALDDKISHNQTQLNALKQYKHGLLQQMFV
jgi:type I restriction enzyme S subunit